MGTVQPHHVSPEDFICGARYLHLFSSPSITSDDSSQVPIYQTFTSSLSEYRGPFGKYTGPVLGGLAYGLFPIGEGAWDYIKSNAVWSLTTTVFRTVFGDAGFFSLILSGAKVILLLTFLGI